MYYGYDYYINIYHKLIEKAIEDELLIEFNDYEKYRIEYDDEKLYRDTYKGEKYGENDNYKKYKFNTDCSSCLNCTRCIGCVNCTNCRNCKYCKNCTDCENLYNKSNCKKLHVPDDESENNFRIIEKEITNIADIESIVKKYDNISKIKMKIIVKLKNS